MSEYRFDKYLDTAEPTAEPTVSQFYDYAAIIGKRVAWLGKEDLDDLAEYGNELIGVAEDYENETLQVYMELDGSVQEETDASAVLQQVGRTNIVGELTDFTVQKQDGQHTLYVHVTSTAVGIEGSYRKKIAAEGDQRIDRLAQEQNRLGSNRFTQLDGRMIDMRLDVTRLSGRMTGWRFRQTREIEKIFQSSWCLESQHLWRLLGMKTMNMRDEQLLEYEVAINMYLEDTYRHNLSVKACFVKPEVVNMLENDPGATRRGVALTHVGEETSLIALRLQRNRGQKLDVRAYLESCSDRDRLYELDVTSARDVLFGTLENLRQSQNKSF